MALTPGTKLGPYQIIAPLGAGGMGEVYRARDTRLGRDIAVKVLPQHLSTNPEVRARFEREAKAVSALNHPNICTLHDVGCEGDTDYLVMELVEGKTLAARLDNGALPAAETIRIGVQIAEALDRAHRAGVIHRDLKPGNVMLTKSGAKLMDFGLARATGLAASGGTGSMTAAVSQSPTMATPLTAEGRIIGTFQYMAPEQLEGKEADARSDLWALGCVLYEMATGRRPFEGRSQASLIGSIMGSEPPPLSRTDPMAPPALDELVRACLAKDPDERWQSAGDLRRQLQRIQNNLSGSGTTAVIARRRTLSAASVGWIVAGMIALAAIVYAIGPWSAKRVDERLLAFTISPPEGMQLVQPAEAELSPDGRMLAFKALDSALIPNLVVRPLASLEARVIPGTQRCALPFWSPDSRTIAFFSDGKLRKVALDGAAPVVLCDAPDPRGGAWSSGDVIVFAPSNEGPLMRVPAQGGAPVQVTKIDPGRQEKGHRYPQFLPDGKRFLFVAIGRDEMVTTYAASIEGGPVIEVLRGGSEGRYALPGYLLYLETGVSSAARRVLARRFDSRNLQTMGDAHLVLDAVDATNFGYPNLTANARGDLVVQHWADAHLELEWTDRDGRPSGIAVKDLDGSALKLSPDGKRLAYAGNHPRDLYTLDLASGVITRLTFENRSVSDPVWSPDGRSIAFARLMGSAGWEARVKAADGSGPDSLVYHAPGLFAYPQSWSPDGRWLLAACSDAAGNLALWRLPVAGQGGEPEAYQRAPAEAAGNPGGAWTASISPDGKWAACTVNESGTRSLYVQSFPSPGSIYQVSVPSPARAVWSERGDELIVVDRNNGVTAIEVSTAGGFHQKASHKLFEPAHGTLVRDYDQTTGRFLLGQTKDRTTLSSLEVILGWPALVKN